MKKAEYVSAQKEAAAMICMSEIQISQQEAESIEVVDFGLNDLRKEGAQILTLVQTDRISVKIIALFPDQTEPEHWHPKVGDDPGKEETIRVIRGILYLYQPGGDTMRVGQVPKNKDNVYTCRNELILNVNDQVTLSPGTKHWFRSGNEGAVIFSFSTVARDTLDRFSDSAVIRISKIEA